VCSSDLTVASAARDSDREPDDVRVLPYVAAVVDDDREVARDSIRTNVASYVGGFSDDSYKNAVGEGFAEEADRIAEAWRRGDEAEAKAAVTDEMIDALGIAGTPTEAREKLDALRERPIVDEVILAIPHSVDPETARRTVRELAPDGD
jgi:alkanesulfonate monooxygenase SsuD/methylene tetrahydromethanopterin reductase-like flavin-dependent oxidoreductase (luciferase family)